jgi:hypothetical protein
MVHSEGRKDRQSPSLGPHDDGVLLCSEGRSVDALFDVVLVSFSALPRSAVFCWQGRGGLFGKGSGREGGAQVRPVRLTQRRQPHQARLLRGFAQRGNYPSHWPPGTSPCSQVDRPDPKVSCTRTARQSPAPARRRGRGKSQRRWTHLSSASLQGCLPSPWRFLGAGSTTKPPSSGLDTGLRRWADALPPLPDAPAPC